MRTKTLLLGAALLAASLVISSAQPVYSANVVGYINQVIPPGYSLAANQLDTTNNTVSSLMPGMSNGVTIYKFVGDGYATPNSFTFGAWTDPNMTLNPGEGFFIYNPYPNPITNAFVGTVLQGTFTNAVPLGYTLQSYYVPISGTISTALSYPAESGDTIWAWDSVGQTFVPYSYAFGSWNPSEPILNVGQSFFVDRQLGESPSNWVTTFTAQ